jgi:hypothetical protein
MRDLTHDTTSKSHSSSTIPPAVHGGDAENHEAGHEHGVNHGPEKMEPKESVHIHSHQHSQAPHHREKHLHVSGVSQDHRHDHPVHDDEISNHVHGAQEHHRSAEVHQD